MNKRYQVFVSSTFSDLGDERRAVMQILMAHDCIPAGMEMFGAVDEEQLEFIKRVIDDCDYYMVIIGGRYGTVTAEGVSYTEKEYDYAKEKGLKVIAFLHEHPDELPVKKTDGDPNAKQRLLAFRDKVSKGRLVAYWETADQLAAKVSVAMSRAIKVYPAIGWVRADQVASAELLAELNQLRKDHDQLRLTAEGLTSAAKIENLAELDELITLNGSFGDVLAILPRSDWSVTVSWRDVLRMIGPHLIPSETEPRASSALASELFRVSEKKKKSISNDEMPSLNAADFQTVKVQFLALGLLDIMPASHTSNAPVWILTKHGKMLVMDLRSVKSTPQKKARHRPK